MDQRAQSSTVAAVGALAFFGTIIAGALLFLMLDQAWSPIMDVAANNTNTTQANASAQRYHDAWDNWPIWILTLAFVMGISSAAAAGRIG